MTRVFSNIEKGKLVLFLTQKYVIKDSQLRMTYNDIREFLGIMPDGHRNIWLKKGVASIKYHLKIWQMKFRMTSPFCLSVSVPLFLSLSLWRPVIVKICIIKASTVEPKCLCCSNWRCSQIFTNSFGKNCHWLNNFLRSSLTKSKKRTFERKKKMLTSVNQIIRVSNIHIFSLISYLLENLNL